MNQPSEPGLTPGYADRYLARHGFAAQTTGVPHDPARPSNLFALVPGDPVAHGRFDAGAIAGAMRVLRRRQSL